MTFKDKLRQRAKKVQKNKLLKKFSPENIILSPYSSEKYWIWGENIKKVIIKKPLLDKNWNKIKEEKTWQSKSWKIFKKLVVKTEKQEKEIVKYTFIVAKNANKNDIKQAIVKIYWINPSDIVKVNTMIVPSKRRSYRWIVRKSYKKAIITLKPWVRLKID